MKLLNRLSLFYIKNKKAAKATSISKTTIDLQYHKQVHSQKLNHIPNTKLPSQQSRNILITSALPYVNNTPHLGNIIGAVLSADVYARYCRLMGYNVIYICGTDQYGTATEVKALQQKTTPRQICNKYHELHKNIYKWFDISFDHFGRTSLPIHTKITQEIFNNIYHKKCINEKASSQLYCQSCDLFLADRYVNGKCKKCGNLTRGDQCDSCSTIFNNLIEEIAELSCSICKHSPIQKQTKHLYLNLQKQKQNLKKWLFEEGTIQSWNNNAKGSTKSWFNLPPHDRCISRDLKWGVPVPLSEYEKKVFYVWFQATIGYISITADFLGQEYLPWWKKDENKPVELNQFMGKDNIIFHSIISPASLMSANDNWILPSKLSVTEYLNYEGGKFSKSHNKGVFGDDCRQTGLSSQYWRFYLLRIRPQNYDSQFIWSDFAQKCNKELLNSIGNMTQRILKFYFNSYGKTIIPLNLSQFGYDEQCLINDIQAKFNNFKNNMQLTNLLQSTQIAVEIANTINQYIGKTQFWKNQKKQMIIALLLRVLKIYSSIIQPIVPSLSAKINFLLGCQDNMQQAIYRQFDNMKRVIGQCLKDSKGIRQPVALIKQITQKDVDSFRQRFGVHKQKSIPNNQR